MSSKLVRAEPLYWWRGKLYWTYRWVQLQYAASDCEWESLDEWSLFIGAKPADLGWFKWHNIEVDEYKLKALVVFGLAVGWMHQWQAVPLEEPYDPRGFDMDPFDLGEF